MSRSAIASRLGAAVALALVACGGSEWEEPLWEQERTIHLEVTSDAAFERLELLLGENSIGITQGRGVVTPAMLAAGIQPSPNSELWQASVTTHDFAVPIRSAQFTFKTPGFQDLRPNAVVAIAYAGDPRVAIAAGVMGNLQATDDRTVYTAKLEANAHLASAVELWGTGTLCGRFDRSMFFVDRGDLDCDGIRNDDDCAPSLFCDPDATTPEAQAGCNIPTCARCVLDGEVCGLGTQRTCHDVRGQPPVYSCDTGGACGGVPVCLPATACQLDCEVDPKADPVRCMEQAWGDGAQPDDAIDCPLPTAATPSGSRSCAGGSTVQVALPFTDCRDPHVLIGYSTDVAASSTLRPPCTLSVTIDSTQRLVDQPLLVALGTDTGSATVRLMLRPTDGVCSGVSACAAVPPTATCTQ